MRHVLLWFALVACNSTPDMPSQCQGECRPEDLTCTTSPAGCGDSCYRDNCCYLMNGMWNVVTFECGLPPFDAGVDAPRDGALDV
jgi:hypothetical protein